MDGVFVDEKMECYGSHVGDARERTCGNLRHTGPNFNFIIFHYRESLLHRRKGAMSGMLAMI